MDHAHAHAPSRRIPADVVIGRLAAEQHGVVTRVQLTDAGISRHRVDGRVRRGLLRPLHAGVYQVGPVAAPRAREVAAVLACGDGAVVSHRSAAALWQLLPPQRSGDAVDIALPAHVRRGRRPGVCPHRVALRADEITRAEGIPATTPARTLFDLATVCDTRGLERALAAAERDGLLSRDALRSLLRRRAAQPGSLRLRTLLDRGAAAAFTRSEAEEQLLALLRSAGLPDPEVNVVVHGFEVDFLWRRAHLAVEVDGYAWHGSATTFVRDRQRDTALAAAGIQVVRVSWHQLRHEREKTLVQLAQALARR